MKRGRKAKRNLRPLRTRDESLSEFSDNESEGQISNLLNQTSTRPKTILQNSQNTGLRETISNAPQASSAPPATYEAVTAGLGSIGSIDQIENPAFDVNNECTQTVDTKCEKENCKSVITVGSISPRIFDGNEDVDEWIEHFLYVSKCNSWPEIMQKRRFPIYLKDAAQLWFKDFSELKADKSGSYFDVSMQAILEELRTTFRPRNINSINQSALICRYQGLDEPVTTYHFDVLRLCKKVNPKMSESEKLTHCMRGLKSSLLERVLLLEPENTTDLLNKCRGIEEAQFLSNRRPNYNLLLVKENQNKTLPEKNNEQIKPKETKQFSTTELTDLCKSLKELLIKEKNFDLVNFANMKGYNPYGGRLAMGGQAYQEQQSFRGRPHYNYRWNQPQVNHGWHQPQVFRGWYEPQGNRGENNSQNKREWSKPQSYQNEFKPQNSGSPYPRTVDGRPICLNCKTPGHFAKYCPKKPRLNEEVPNDGTNQPQASQKQGNQ